VWRVSGSIVLSVIGEFPGDRGRSQNANGLSSLDDLLLRDLSIPRRPDLLPFRSATITARKTRDNSNARNAANYTISFGKPWLRGHRSRDWIQMETNEGALKSRGGPDDGMHRRYTFPQFTSESVGGGTHRQSWVANFHRGSISGASPRSGRILLLGVRRLK
jgi:hypothetical protein